MLEVSKVSMVCRCEEQLATLELFLQHDLHPRPGWMDRQPGSLDGYLGGVRFLYSADCTLHEVTIADFMGGLWRPISAACRLIRSDWFECQASERSGY
jgi:hypothetical protein